LVSLVTLFWLSRFLFSLTETLAFQDLEETVTLVVIGIAVFGALLYLTVKLIRHLSEPKTVELDSKKVRNAGIDGRKKRAVKPYSPGPEVSWIEKELICFNEEMFGEQRPPKSPTFFQRLPKSFLSCEILTTSAVEELALSLVDQTRGRIGKMEIPFRRPVVEFTELLPNNEPGHIEFGWQETTIRMHPRLRRDPFALAAVLCHELAHFILDQNGLRRDDTTVNERLTDLFVFKCGQGLIYLQGILEVNHQANKITESRLGYLTLEEMAYAHVRCASQFGLDKHSILPGYFIGKQFDCVSDAIDFLQIGDNELAEIILCNRNHALRLSRYKASSKIRCPKCGWQEEIWLHRRDRENYLIEQGTRAMESSFLLEEALLRFREVQAINKTNSSAYCLASQTLKKMGRHQDAIRELRKLLEISPNDPGAQEEMKRLI